MASNNVIAPLAAAAAAVPRAVPSSPLASLSPPFTAAVRAASDRRPPPLCCAFAPSPSYPSRRPTTAIIPRRKMRDRPSSSPLTCAFLGPDASTSGIPAISSPAGHTAARGRNNISPRCCWYPSDTARPASKPSRRHLPIIRMSAKADQNGGQGQDYGDNSSDGEDYDESDVDYTYENAFADLDDMDGLDENDFLADYYGNKNALLDDDDEDFLLQIGDELVVAARLAGDDGGGGMMGGDGSGGSEYRSIDDETLLEILGLPDDARGVDQIDDDDAFDLQGLIMMDRADPDPDRGEVEVELERTFEPVRAASASFSAASSANQALRPDASSVFTPLENALLQGVVPADAGVGSGALPGDFGFDPLNLASKDYFKRTQRFVLGLLPERRDDDGGGQEQEHDVGYDGSALPKGSSGRIADQDERPPALILRDYREAEIRHGRLAMLAAIIWPLQEILDRLFIPDSFGSTTIIYGGPTLPYLTLLMTFFMLNLGYLDIYAAAIKSSDTGEAFLPGECFWDPLSILNGAPDSMKRNMQQRELFNGRIAMLTVACYIFEEAISHRPLVTHQINQFLFEPAYQIPAVQAWLDQQFSSASPVLTFPEKGTAIDFVGTLREVLDEEAEAALEKAAQEAAASFSSGTLN